MPVDLPAYQALKNELSGSGAELVAVSKTKPVAEIMELYDAGQRDFGENYVQELLSKQPLLPSDIRWHFIGHLQSNKVKLITPFVHLIHGIDSLNLLKTINRQGMLINRRIDCLLQVHIASEDSKFGFSIPELESAIVSWNGKEENRFARVVGLMGMASFTDDISVVRAEFTGLAASFQHIRSVYFPDDPSFRILSMGMSGDYRLALACGSTMVRIGSILFGSRHA